MAGHNAELDFWGADGKPGSAPHPVRQDTALKGGQARDQWRCPGPEESTGTKEGACVYMCMCVRVHARDSLRDLQAFAGKAVWVGSGQGQLC